MFKSLFAVIGISSVLILSGCGAHEYIKNKAVDEAIEEGNITQISDYLYSGRSENNIFSKETKNRTSKERWEIFCERKGKNSYIQSSTIDEEWYRFVFACVDKNDNSEEAKKYIAKGKQFLIDDIANENNITKVSDNTYKMPREKSKRKIAKISSEYCSKQNLTMKAVHLSSVEFIFACKTYEEIANGTSNQKQAKKVSKSSSTVDMIETLKELNTLLENKMITKEEFNKLKSELSK